MKKALASPLSFLSFAQADRSLARRLGSACLHASMNEFPRFASALLSTRVLRALRTGRETTHFLVPSRDASLLPLFPPKNLGKSTNTNGHSDSNLSASCVSRVKNSVVFWAGLPLQFPGKAAAFRELPVPDLMPTQRSPPVTPGPNTGGIDGEIEELCRTLNKSRKRHLPSGLLRGDRIVDQLAVQEASASPLLKKSKLLSKPTTPPDPDPDPAQSPTAAPEPNNMALTMAEFREYMEKNTNRRLENLDKAMGGLTSEVRGNSDRISAQEGLIKRNQSEISEIRTELERMKAVPPDWPPVWPSAPPTRSAEPSTSRENEAQYDRARRSLRLWPVLGSTTVEIWSATRAFLTDKLKVTDVGESAVESITRAKTPSGPGVQDEVIVVFRDAQVRDRMIGCAAALSDFVDTNGRPTAGMRMEIPPMLNQAFKTLFRYGKALRARHGKGTRRHVKFDDTTRSLYLNAKLPGDVSWSKVSLELASKGVKARQALTDGEIEKRLDITGTPASPPAPARLPAPQPMALDDWTGMNQSQNPS